MCNYCNDSRDDDVLVRRIAGRQSHFEMARKLKTHNRFVPGGALLNETGTMEGSVMIVQFETEDVIKQRLENEPYTKESSWQEIEMKKFKVVDVQKILARQELVVVNFY